MSGPEWVRVEVAVVEKHGADAAVVLGLMAYRCAPTGTWAATIADVVAQSGLTDHRVRAALRSLRDTGLVSSRRADRFRPDLTWSVAPGHTVNGDSHVTCSGESPSPVTGKSRVTSCREPTTEEPPPTPLADDPLALLEVELVAAPERVLSVVPALDPLDAEFDEFWSRYPRKVAKKPARAAWARARKHTPLETIARGLVAQLPDLRRREPSKVPYPATWLNQERWTDDPRHAAQAEGDRPRNRNRLLDLDGRGDEVLAGLLEQPAPFPTRVLGGAR